MTVLGRSIGVVWALLLCLSVAGIAGGTLYYQHSVHEENDALRDGGSPASQVAETKSRLAAARERTHELNETLRASRTDIADAEARLDDSESNESREALARARSNLSDVREDLDALEADLQSMERRVDRLESEGPDGADFERELDALGDEITDLSMTLNTVRKYVDRLDSRIDSICARAAEPKPEGCNA